MIRHNTSFIKFGSKFEVVDMTDYSLVIQDPSNPSVLINFPAHPSNHIIDADICPMKVEEYQHRIINEFVKVQYISPEYIEGSERFAVVALYSFGNNIPNEDQELFINFLVSVREVICRKLSVKRMIERIEPTHYFIPMVPEPTWKDKMKLVFDRIFRFTVKELPEPRPSKDLFYPNMNNINFDVIVKHSFIKIIDRMTEADINRLDSVGSYAVFKVIDLNNKVLNEVQVIIEKYAL